MTKILIVMIMIALSSCSLLEGQPERTWYEYEETTSLCAKVMEFPDRVVIFYVDCAKAPESIKRVRFFGEGVGDED